MVRRYIIRRVLLTFPVLIGITVVIFALMHAIPGDPVQIMFGDETSGAASNPEEVARIRRLLGLDQPLPIQYLRWLGQVLTGNLGMSLLERVPVGELLSGRFPATLELTGITLMFSAVVAIPLGVLAAVYRNSWFDRLALVMASLGVSMPGFWIALMMIIMFSLWLQVLPTSGRAPDSVLGALWMTLSTGDLKHLWTTVSYLIMPALSLSAHLIAMISRLTRFSMLEVLKQDYIRTARAKGVAGRGVIFRHALRNALLPVITVLGVQVGYLMSGTVLIETIFAWPGIGRLGWVAIKRLDYPVIQGVVLLVATIFVVMNLVTDLVYAAVDPRIQYD